jgi:hypothetical protein
MIAFTYPKGFTTVAELIASRSKERQEGYDAVGRDLPHTANPYPVPGRRAAEWDEGYREAVEEFGDGSDTDLWEEVGGES